MEAHKAPTPTPAPPKPVCEHKFLDSKQCVRCGWTPTPDSDTISLLAQSLYAARLEIDRLTANEISLTQRLNTALTVLDVRFSLAVEEEEFGPFKTMIYRYLEAHAMANYGRQCQCNICQDARRTV